ncbi:hypothetical protein J2Z17_004347 [Rhizobium halophytocola]|uniref:Uncharacterized protein n=1 Tax=Rhizobium halophytocola TaxID=735519 RepID=A0ABS4E4L1_9HYPH|nr:hypothetical protein [Rhizobium halophytocola]
MRDQFLIRSVTQGGKLTAVFAWTMITGHCEIRAVNPSAAFS